MTQRPPHGLLEPSNGAAPTAPLGILGWLKREGIALLGVAGASLTVMGQLAGAMPMLPLLRDTVALWQRLTHDLWRPPAAVFGTTLHPHIVAALTLAVFLLTIGVGARISARLMRTRSSVQRPLFWHLGEESWPSLMVFAALCAIFVVGHGGDRLVLFGSEQLGGYAFAVPVAAGYIAGSAIGDRAFDARMLRLAIVVALLIGANTAALWCMGQIGGGART